MLRLIISFVHQKVWIWRIYRRVWRMPWREWRIYWRINQETPVFMLIYCGSHCNLVEFAGHSKNIREKNRLRMRRLSEIRTHCQIPTGISRKPSYLICRHLHCRHLQKTYPCTRYPSSTEHLIQLVDISKRHLSPRLTSRNPSKLYGYLDESWISTRRNTQAA